MILGLVVVVFARLIVLDKHVMFFDVGEGAASRLLTCSPGPLTDLVTIFLTHCHGDHVID